MTGKVEMMSHKTDEERKDAELRVARAYDILFEAMGQWMGAQEKK